MSASHPAVNRAELPVLRDASTLLLSACFLLSGLAALVYQIAWARQLALVFGTSELAVATVLAAYMGGLALGAWLARRWLAQIKRPVLVYASLELGIGASALVLVPVLLQASDTTLTLLFGGQPAPPNSEQVATAFFYLLSAFIAVALPTVLMGATLPLLARHAVRTDEQIGSRIGLLYSMNTAGAVAGALLTAFWLLPTLGLTGTVRAAAAVNVLVFLIAAAIAGNVRHAPAKSSRPAELATARSWRLPDPRWVLPVMALSGAVAFFHEVLWTRMLSHVLGSSIHAFGVMVGSFLAGIAIGGALGAMVARDRPLAVRGLSLAQLGSAAAAASAYVALEAWMPQARGLAATASFGAAILLPLTLFIGSTYPLAVRVLAAHADEAAAVSARVYTWNTVGAICGALAAGFFLIPALRFEGAVQLAVAASAVLAIAVIWMLERAGRLIISTVTAASLALVALFRPQIPEALIRSSPLHIASHGDIAYYEVGRSASVLVLEQDGGLALRTNGLPEALMEMPGTAPRFSGEFWLSPLAVLARPDVRDMLVIGFGGGVVIEVVPPSVRSVDVIEIEPRVIEANLRTRGLRKRDPLSDPRVQIVTNDARGALRLTDRRYDAIVSQPSHPWTAGASHLYTLELMREAREHLNAGGVFVQWMNVSFLDEPLLRSLTATLLEAFGAVRIYRPDPSTLVFLASTEPLDVELRAASAAVPPSRSARHYAQVGINNVEELIAALAVDQEGAERLARGAQLITDDHNRLATSTIYDMRRGLSATEMGALLAPYDPLQRAESWIYRQLGEHLAYDYIARRQLAFLSLDASVPDRLARMADLLGPRADAEIIRALVEAAADRNLEARRVVREALAHYPDDDRLRFELLRTELPQLARGRASEEAVEIAAEVRDPTLAALIRAVQHVARGEWQAVAELDPVLARTRWTDPWLFEVLQVRADWRSRASGAPRRKLAGECIDLVDRRLIVQPAISLYGLRARCAAAADRTDVVIESLWTFGHATFMSALELPLKERASAKQDLEAILNVLDAHAGANVARAAAERFDRARLEEVRTRLADALERLDYP